MALLIKTDGSERNVFPTGKTFSLEELQGFVGGMIQLVPLPGGQMIGCNEAGKMENLPMNRKATALYGYFLLPGDYLAGDVLVLNQGEIE